MEAALDRVAKLRIRVFRDWPYLYDGDLAYERRYLEPYRDNPRAVVAGAFDGDTLVGAATGMPMEDHADEFASAFEGTGLDLSDIFYCAESVLLPDYRGHGVGHRFFDIREGKAAELGRRHVVFCGVQRPAEHPARPADYRPLDAFWRKRGYRPLPGVVAQYHWKDIGDAGESAKPLQFWIRELT
nr:GNAT family N-acetyltransferase [Rhodobacter sp. NTK016B]